MTDAKNTIVYIRTVFLTLFCVIVLSISCSFGFVIDDYIAAVLANNIVKPYIHDLQAG